MNLCFYMALRSIPFGIAVAIEFSGPLTVALLGSRRPIDFLWIVLAAAGLGVLLPGVHSASTLDALGLTYALAAAVLWATYIVAGKRLGHLHAGHSVSLGLTVAAIVVVPIGLAHAGAAVMSPTVLLVGVCVAALSSAIPISLEMVALKRLPKQAFGVMLSMEPAMAALLGLALLDERLSAMQWLAIGAIMAASMGTAFTAQRPAAPPAVFLQGGS
jgi:inner membrane transporter RhtA